MLKYARGLEQFSAWLESRGESVTNVDFVDLEHYLAFLLNEKGYADKTVHTRYVPVRLFYNYLKKLGRIPENPAEEVDTRDYYRQSNTKQEEVTGEERRYLSKSEVSKLAKNVPDPSIRNRLLVEFIYYTGMRRDEVSQVRIDKLDRENRTVEVTAKGGNTLTAVWHENLDELLTQWLDYGYRASYPTASDSPYLFVSRHSDRLRGRRIGDIVVEAAENAGLQETMYIDARGRNRNRVTTHILRHSFAMHFLADGGSLEALSNRLAHSSITTTEIYGEIGDDRGIEEYNEHMKGLDDDTE